jgi:hypothetical protein
VKVALIFPRWTNWVPLVLLLAGGPITAGVVLGVWYYAAPEFTDIGYSPEQPVPYSHKLHAGKLGIDCRYCHNTVEMDAAAAVPPTATCMNCHSVIKTDSPKLAPVREAWETGDPIEWVRVHMTPDYAYFNHSAHMAAGVGCVSCHGRIDQMTEVAQDKSLAMSWCLKCHNDPAPNLRPKNQVTNMAWSPADSPDFDADAVASKLSPPTHCSGCHR